MQTALSLRVIQSKKHSVRYSAVVFQFPERYAPFVHVPKQYRLQHVHRIVPRASRPSTHLRPYVLLDPCLLHQSVELLHRISQIQTVFKKDWKHCLLWTKINIGEFLVHNWIIPWLSPQSFTGPGASSFLFWAELFHSPFVCNPIRKWDRWEPGSRRLLRGRSPRSRAWSVFLFSL